MRHDFRIVKIAPDGKCMFRALASGMSFNAGYYIVGSEEEEADAGEAAVRSPAVQPPGHYSTGGTCTDGDT